MSPAKDFRIELILLIPAIWLVLQLGADSKEENQRQAPPQTLQVKMSDIKFLPASAEQKGVLFSLFQLEHVPVNLANAELLTTVPGIGPTLAARIIATRARSGYFHTPGDLTRVHGIGPRRAQQFQQYLRFD